MKISQLSLLGILAVSLLPVVHGQARQSPHETVSGKAGDANITITYGRPYKKTRQIFGGLVPYGKVWRTGADEATTIETDRDLMIGSVHVPAGIYGLFTLPSDSGWKLIVNKTAKQWGAFEYDAGQDLGRVEMEVSSGSEVEQFTIALEPKSDGFATLKLAWDTTVATIPIMGH